MYRYGIFGNRNCRIDRNFQPMLVLNVFSKRWKKLCFKTVHNDNDDDNMSAFFSLDF